MRRAKALSFSGCKSRPATVAPAEAFWVVSWLLLRRAQHPQRLDDIACSLRVPGRSKEGRAADEDPPSGREPSYNADAPEQRPSPVYLFMVRWVYFSSKRQARDTLPTLRAPPVARRSPLADRHRRRGTSRPRWPTRLGWRPVLGPGAWLPRFPRVARLAHACGIVLSWPLRRV